MATKFTAENGYLIVGKSACPFCSGSGEVLTKHKCSVCGGTGRGPKGGEGGCRNCLNGETYGPDMSTCPVCKGKDSAEFADGHLSDPLPVRILMKIPIEYRGSDNPHPGGKLIEEHDGQASSYYTKEKMVGVALAKILTVPIPADRCVLHDEHGLRLPDCFVVYIDRYGYVIKPVWKDQEED